MQRWEYKYQCIRKRLQWYVDISNAVYNISAIRSRIVPYEIESKRQRPNFSESQDANIEPNNEYHIAK